MPKSLSRLIQIVSLGSLFAFSSIRPLDLFAADTRPLRALTPVGDVRPIPKKDLRKAREFDCAPKPPEAFKNATAVFSGTLDNKHFLSGSFDTTTALLLFKVKQTYKGNLGENVEVYILPALGGRLFLQRDQDYLVYATSEPGYPYVMGKCTATKTVNEAKLDFAMLASLGPNASDSEVDKSYKQALEAALKQKKAEAKAKQKKRPKKVKTYEPSF